MALQLDGTETKKAILVPLWIVNSGNAALSKMAQRPVMVAIDELGMCFRGEVQDLTTTHSLVVPEGCFYLCKSVYVEISFRFEDTRYTLTGEAMPSKTDQSFLMEFDTVARKLMNTLGARLGAAGLIEASKLPAEAEETAAEEEKSETNREKTKTPVQKMRWVRHDPPPDGIERRLHQRYEVELATHLTLVEDGTRQECTMVELSVGGCRLLFPTACEIPCGTQVEVQFIGDGLPLRLAAVVQVRSHERLAGLRFVNMVPRMKERLEGFAQEISASAVNNRG